MTRPLSIPVGTSGTQAAYRRPVEPGESLDQLRGIVLAYPRMAERVLNERRVPDPVLRYTLRAESHLRLGKLDAAYTAALCAVQTAAEETPVDPARLLPAATVLADSRVLANTPDAITTCTQLADLAEQYSDHQRLTIAALLRAVAVYHHQSCREAQYLLHLLNAPYTDDRSVISTTVALARNTIDTCCQRRHHPHQPSEMCPVVTAGGLVFPGLAPQVPRDRILRWPGTHDCASHPPSPTAGHAGFSPRPTR